MRGFARVIAVVPTVVFVLTVGAPGRTEAVRGGAPAGFEAEWAAVAETIHALPLGYLAKLSLTSRVKSELQANAEVFGGSIPVTQIRRLLQYLANAKVPPLTLVQATNVVDAAARLDASPGTVARLLYSVETRAGGASLAGLETVARAYGSLVASLRRAEPDRAAKAIETAADVAVQYLAEADAEYVARVVVALGDEARAESSSGGITELVARIDAALGAGVSAATLSALVDAFAPAGSVGAAVFPEAGAELGALSGE